MKLAPKVKGSFFLVYQENFKSPFLKDTESEAQKVLDEIRLAHPASKGWEEIEAYVEQMPNGKYRAVRNHALYRLEDPIIEIEL